MDRLKRGVAFLIQAWRMVRADPDLLKPSIYALIVGVFVTLIGLIPIIASVLLFADRSYGQVLTGFFAVLLLFAQMVVGYVFSAMTVYLVYGYLAEGDGDLKKAWAIVRRDWLDLLALAAASTLVNLIKSAARRKRSPSNLLAGILGAVWTEATYLVLPAMVIEDLGLVDGMRRVSQIVRDQLLLVGISMVGVRLVNGLIGVVLGILGAGIGAAVGFGLANLGGDSLAGMVIGIGLGLFLTSLFFMVSVVIGSYTATAYHTCLYLWARDVEMARQRSGAAAASADLGGLPSGAAAGAGAAEFTDAPGPLAAALGEASSFPSPEMMAR
jgi:hypothetical protein